MLLKGPGVTLFVLQLLGLISLSALLLTIILSEKINRHPVFINLVCTFIVYTSFMVFFNLTYLSLSPSEQDLLFNPVMRALENSLRMIGSTSTLNLLIHLWFAMRAACQGGSATAQLRTVTLLVSPYLMGLVSLSELFCKKKASYDMDIKVVGYIHLLLIIKTTLWDLLLLSTFYRHGRIFRQVDMQKVVTLSHLIRLLILSVLQVLFMAIFAIYAAVESKHPNSPAVLTLTNVANAAVAVFPFFAFCLLGLHRDIIQVWFPGLNFSAARHDTLPSTLSSHA